MSWTMKKQLLLISQKKFWNSLIVGHLVYAKALFFLSLQICETSFPQGHVDPVIQTAQAWGHLLRSVVFKNKCTD